ncbi:MAG: hypothetical protein HYR49_04620 [Gammaproteobacteria bacterium]|nr:hypothetical protein [Gammaproteobacteria bacterium]
MTWIRHGAAAVGGLAAGMLLVLGGLLLWPFPFADPDAAAIVAMDDAHARETFHLNIPTDGVLATHGGAFPFRPFPAALPEFGDPLLHEVFALVTKFRDRPDGNVMAFGTELEIAHERSRLLRGLVMTHTVWSIVVPGRGTLHLYQVENNWRLLKRVFLPMLLTGHPFDGSFTSVNTLGPLPAFRGRIIGGTGEFSGRTGAFVEIGHLQHLDREGGLSGTMALRIGYDAARP